MRVDERDHGLNQRSNSAIAKSADALRRISLACRGSRFSRSRTFSRLPSALVGPARRPRSRSRAADLAGNRADRRPLRRVLAPVLQAPGAPHVRALQPEREVLSSSSSPQSLKTCGLRESRDGSDRLRGEHSGGGGEHGWQARARRFAHQPVRGGDVLVDLPQGSAPARPAWGQARDLRRARTAEERHPPRVQRLHGWSISKSTTAIRRSSPSPFADSFRSRSDTSKKPDRRPIGNSPTHNTK